MSLHEHSSIARRRNSARRFARAKVAQRLLQAIQRWQRNRALTALQALPDIYLKSIRTARGDIPEIANDLFPTELRTMPLHPTPSASPRIAERVPQRGPKATAVERFRSGRAPL
jgi:hypothetical protein